MERERAWKEVLGRLSDGACVSAPDGRILYMNAAAENILGSGDWRGKILCDLVCANLTAPGRRDCSSTCTLRDPESLRAGVSYQGRYFGSQVSPQVKGLRVRCLRMPSGSAGPEPSDHRLVLIEEAPPGDGSRFLWEAEDPLAARDLRAASAEAFSALQELQALPVGHAFGESDKRLAELGVGACARLLRMVELHQEVLRLEEGLASLRRERISIGPLIRAAVEKAEPAALERQVGIDVKVSDGLHVLADGRLLSRVLDDLLTNGLRAAPAGGRVSLTAVRAAGSKARLCFENASSGAAPEKLAEIFDRVYQARALKEERRRGMGLRWIFCHRAVRAMDGNFELLCDSESGARAVVDLPAAA